MMLVSLMFGFVGIILSVTIFIKRQNPNKASALYLGIWAAADFINVCNGINGVVDFNFGTSVKLRIYEQVQHSSYANDVHNICLC